MFLRQVSDIWRTAASHGAHDGKSIDQRTKVGNFLRPPGGGAAAGEVFQQGISEENLELDLEFSVHAAGVLTELSIESIAGPEIGDNCAECDQSRIPVFQSIIKFISELFVADGGGGGHIRIFCARLVLEIIE